MLTGKKVSDTTTRTRRNEWIKAGVFRLLEQEAQDAYDNIIGLDLSETSIDGSTHKAPSGGEGTGKSPVDRGKIGWKWSILVDANGVPLSWTIAGANRNDCKILLPTLADAVTRGILDQIERLHLDKGYDSKEVRWICEHMGVENPVIAKKRKRGTPEAKEPLTLGLRWPVERTNSWLSNFGQLRRNTDRSFLHRITHFGLAVVFLITAKLIDWRNGPSCR
jgi:transposase